MSLRSNVLAAVVTATAALVATLILLGDPLVEHRLTHQVRQDLVAAASSAVERLGDGEREDAVADALGAQHACVITVIDEHGITLGDTALDGADLGLPFGDADEVEIERAWLTGEGYAARVPPWADAAHPDAHVLHVARRASEGRVVRASRSLATIRATRHTMRELLVIGGVVAAVVAALLTLALSRTFIGPVEELTRVADAVADGDLTVRTRSDRSDELGRLGRALDRVGEQLEQRLDAVRAEAARLQTMLDAMVEAVFVTDRKGLVVLTNRALTRLARGSARGKTVMEALGSEELAAAVRAALRDGSRRVEIDLQVGEEERTLTAELARLPDDAGLVAVLHDVTDLKRADRVRRDFVANASHELRTPLTAIRGFTETLRAGAASDPETTERFLDAILRHTHRLQRLVDDLLALSRSESPEQQLELGAVDVARVAAEVVSSLEAQAAQRDIDVRLDGLEELPAALANEWALDHVLVNLVDNAVKYSPANGAVVVSGAASDDAVTISVADTGPGIPAAQRARIFERFYRIDSGRARDQGGTGLGLAIVKHLVQRMDASIEVSSPPGQGATFRLRLRRYDARRGETVGASP